MREIKDLILLEKVGIVLLTMAYESDEELNENEVRILVTELNNMIFNSGLEDTEYADLTFSSDEHSELNCLETMIGYFKAFQGTDKAIPFAKALASSIKDEIAPFNDEFKAWLSNLLVAIAKADGVVTKNEIDWVFGLASDFGLPKLNMSDFDDEGVDYMLEKSDIEPFTVNKGESSLDVTEELEEEETNTDSLGCRDFGDKETNKQAQKYMYMYGGPVLTGEQFTARVPDFFSKIVEACPIWDKDEMERICGFIERYKVIPVLRSSKFGYVPEEFLQFEKQIWWLVPYIGWDNGGNMIASWMFIDKNGFHVAHPSDNEHTHVFPWAQLNKLKLDAMGPEGQEEALMRLTLVCDQGELWFVEYVAPGKGSYLSVIQSIFKVYKKTIEESADAPCWYHGAGGEGYYVFEKPEDLLNESIWKNVEPEDASFYGYKGNVGPHL